MSVPNQTPYIIYTANGLTTVFPFEFYIINAGDLQVSINGTVVTSGYSVSGTGNVGGGDVNFITPPASGSVVMLERVVPTYRLTDYQDNGDLLADTVNKDFDRLWMAIQRSFIYLGLALRRPLLGGPYNAEGYRISKMGEPINPQDAATKNYIDNVALNRAIRVPESYVKPTPGVAARRNKLAAYNSEGDPIAVLPESGSASDVLIELASSENGKGDSLIAVKQPVTGSVARTQHDYNANRVYITDLGAVSGVSSASVDAVAVEMMKAGKAIILPDGFEWKLSATLMCPQNYVPTTLFITIACPDGRAKMTMSSASLMLDQNNTDKFQGAYFENIDFVGFDAQNTASRFMYAPEGRTCSNFITRNCSWTGFHTNYWCTMIATKHYNATYNGCGDTGSVVHVPQWTSGNFSSFNLNEWHSPRFIGKFGSLLEWIGGYNNTFYDPWFEKVESVKGYLFLVRQTFGTYFHGGWLENFKARFFVSIDGDGTENTQSDIIVIDGLHLNNNWSLDPSHSGQASGFEALFNRSAPATSNNNYDTKFCFYYIFEHPDSITGWALTRTGTTLNLASSIHEYISCRLKVGQPNISDGMSLTGTNPDIRRHFRNLSSNKFDFVPGNFGTLTLRNTGGIEKSLVFDDQGDSSYFRRNGVKLLEWTHTYLAPGTANSIQCGVTTRPWSGGFTQTAFTVTSDERHKTNISQLNSSDMNSLLDAWSEVEFSLYQFKDVVEVKGDGARWHFGVIAQRAKDALTRHGLDWTKYAFICYDKWDASDAQYDDEGNLIAPAKEAGDKYGIRYEEALILECALTRREIQRIKELIK